MKFVLDYSYLREILHYNPKTGTWTRRTSFRACYRVGDRADKLGPNGYLYVRIKKRRYPAHRLAIFYMTGTWPRNGTDHKDRNKINNVWTNIRPADQSQNNANQLRHRNNKSGHRGISWNAEKKKWHARLYFRKRVYLLGNFESLEAAASAYRMKARKIFRQFHAE